MKISQETRSSESVGCEGVIDLPLSKLFVIDTRASQMKEGAALSTASFTRLRIRSGDSKVIAGAWLATIEANHPTAIMPIRLTLLVSSCQHQKGAYVVEDETRRI